MAISLNHTIIPARDRHASATFLTEILGLPPHATLDPFAVVQVDDTTLDFMDTDGEIASLHYAFLVSDAEFDAIFGRIRDRRLSYWADPSRREPGRTNDWDGGRGVYFEDPSGHLLEVITRPYGSGVATGSNPHPLFSET